MYHQNFNSQALSLNANKNVKVLFDLVDFFLFLIFNIIFDLNSSYVSHNINENFTLYCYFGVTFRLHYHLDLTKKMQNKTKFDFQ